MYRFVGTKEDVDNYICFGYNNAETDCTENSEYMYRIIGITPSGEIKVIKNIPPGGTRSDKIIWNEYGDNRCDDGSCDWPDSNLFKELNGNFYLNTLSTSWSSKIADHNWWYGDIALDDILGINKESPEDYPANEMYLIETGKKIVHQGWNTDGLSYKDSVWESSQKVKAKIGLMYLHDYYYAYSLDYKSNIFASCIIDELDTNCNNSWLFIGTDYYDMWLGGGEWFMTRYGHFCGHARWSTDGSGTVKCNDVWELNAWKVYESVGWDKVTRSSVYSRPVFYLSTDIQIGDGNGSISKPFIVKE